jgi:hypothetical protein
MANTFSTNDVIPKLLAQGLKTLRQQAIMPRLINRGYEVLAGEKGTTVTIPIASAITAQDVAPANVPPATADVAPTSVTIVLNKWKEAPFYLTDKDVMEVMDGIIPLQAAEAVKAVVNQVEADIFAAIETKVYGFSGTPGTTPFATDLTAFTLARAGLNKQLAPADPRFVVLNADAEGNAVNLRAFQDAAFRGDQDGIINGQIGRKLGSLWVMDQNVPSHAAGAATGYLCNGVTAAGQTAVAINTGTGAYAAGDVVTIAGDSQTYKVLSSVGGGTATSITVSPALKKATVNANAVTVKASHVMNFAAHRDCVALASRPIINADPVGIGHFLSAVDEISGLVLRLEVTREHKRTRFAYDCLYGVDVPRPELGWLIAG